MRCELRLHRHFEKDLARLKRAGWPMEKMTKTLGALTDGPPFSPSWKIHPLDGSLVGVYDMHVAHNWLILFFYPEKNVIELLRTGTHASINLTD